MKKNLRYMPYSSRYVAYGEIFKIGMFGLLPVDRFFSFVFENIQKHICDLRKHNNIEPD